MERRCRADGFAGKPLIFLLLRLVCLTHAFCEFTGAIVYTGQALPLDLDSTEDVAGGRTTVEGRKPPPKVSLWQGPRGSALGCLGEKHPPGLPPLGSVKSSPGSTPAAPKRVDATAAARTIAGATLERPPSPPPSELPLPVQLRVSILLTDLCRTVCTKNKVLPRRGEHKHHEQSWCPAPLR